MSVFKGCPSYEACFNRYQESDEIWIFSCNSCDTCRCYVQGFMDATKEAIPKILEADSSLTTATAAEEKAQQIYNEFIGSLRKKMS